MKEDQCRDPNASASRPPLVGVVVSLVLFLLHWLVVEVHEEVLLLPVEVGWCGSPIRNRTILRHCRQSLLRQRRRRWLHCLLARL